MFAMIFLMLWSLFISPTHQQINLLFTSNWYYSQSIISTVFSEKSCAAFAPSSFSSNINILTPIAELAVESNNLIQKDFKYTIGEDNLLLDFLLPSSPKLVRIKELYPTDDQVMSGVVQLFERLYGNRPRRDIMVVINRTKDQNNEQINNYENVIRFINKQSWGQVRYVEFVGLDNLIYNLRRYSSTFDIITLLQDPTVNRQLMQRVFLNNFMVWIYRWLIVDLLGSIDTLTEDVYRGGVYSSNVTLITFAKLGRTGQTVLLQSAYEVLNSNECKGSSVDLKFDTGIFDGLVRKNFIFNIYLNPGKNIRLNGKITTNNIQNAVAVLENVEVTPPFVLNAQTSLARLRMRPFLIGYNEFYPYAYMNGSQLMGFVVEMLREIMTDLNVTYKFIKVPVVGGVSSHLNPTTLSFSGMLGKVQNGEIDTAAAPFILTINRLTYFDFATDLLTGYIAGLYNVRPVRGLSSLQNYTMPFTWTVWVTFLASALAVTLALALTDWLYPDKRARYRLLMALFFSVSSITHGAYFDPPNRRGGRIVMSFWWAFCLLMVIIWAANYTALLAQEKTEQRLSTFFGLLNQKKYRYGTVDDDLIFGFLEKDQDPRSQAMLRVMRDQTQNGTISDVGAAVNLVRNEPYVLLYTDRILKYQAYNNCFTVFGNWMSFEYGVVLPKYSDFTLAIGNKTTEKRASGRTRALREKYWPATNPNCTSTDTLDIITRWLQQYIPNSYSDALDAGYMVGVFAILLLGGVGSLFLACVEKLIRYIIQHHKDERAHTSLEYTLQQLNF